MAAAQSARAHSRPVAPDSHPVPRVEPQRMGVKPSCTAQGAAVSEPPRVISSVVERFVHIEDVRSSNLLSPTINPSTRFSCRVARSRSGDASGERFAWTVPRVGAGIEVATPSISAGSRWAIVATVCSSHCGPGAPSAGPWRASEAIVGHTDRERAGDRVQRSSPRWPLQIGRTGVLRRAIPRTERQARHRHAGRRL